jgi:hypothetical protein
MIIPFYHKTDNFFIDMIIDFDKEIAKEAVELKTGRITTREGYQVQIEDWGLDDRSGFPIVGELHLSNGNVLGLQTWSNEGKFLIEGDSNFDLVIEIQNEFLDGTSS